MRLSIFLMGMPITIDTPSQSSHSAIKKAFSELKRIDHKFSLYKKDSEAYLYRAGRIKNKDLSSEMKQVIRASKALEIETKGYFSIRHSGSFDPNGYVKGWAIRRAAEIINKQGFSTFCINAGGDILAASNSLKTWRLGVEDPLDPGEIIQVIRTKNLTLATSGTQARGEHIIDPINGQPAKKWLSVSVIGPEIINSDVYATACVAMGTKALDFIDKKTGYEAICVASDGKVYPSSGWDKAVKAQANLAISREVV